MSKQQTTIVQSLPPAVYTEAAVYAQEQERIFSGSWQYACHVGKLRQAGDFLVCQVAGESLILIREDEETINALYNVCAHRAARLLEGEGCKKRFSCPYHAWTYNTRGELISVPNAENVCGFEVGDYRLPRCQVEVVHGLVFVNLDTSALPLRQQNPEFVADLKQYSPDLPALTFVHRTEAHLRANWKVGIENYAECYHCELIHRELVGSVLDFESYQIEALAASQRHLSRPQRGDTRAYEYDETDETEFVAWWLWPNFSFQSYPGGRAHVWKWTPLDVGNTHLTVDWYFRSADMSDWEREMIRHHATTTFTEDQAVIESVQQGLASRGYRAGPLMIDQDNSRYSEHAVAAIQRLWRDAMETVYE